MFLRPVDRVFRMALKHNDGVPGLLLPRDYLIGAYVATNFNNDKKIYRGAVVDCEVVAPEPPNQSSMPTMKYIVLFEDDNFEVYCASDIVEMWDRRALGPQGNATRC